MIDKRNKMLNSKAFNLQNRDHQFQVLYA